MGAGREGIRSAVGLGDDANLGTYGEWQCDRPSHAGARLWELGCDMFSNIRFGALSRDISPSLPSTIIFIRDRDTCMVPSLPPELVAAIVHHVGESHKPEAALRRTSLVARSWRVPSQKALFSTFNLCGRCYHALQIPSLVYLALQTRLGVYVLRISLNRVPSPRKEVALWLPKVCPSVTYIGADFEDDDEIHFVESLGRFAHLKVVALATRNPALGRRAAEELQRVHLSGFEIVSTSPIITDVVRVLSEGAIAQSLIAISTYPNEYMTFGQCFASFTNLRALSLRFLTAPDLSEQVSGADAGKHTTQAIRIGTDRAQSCRWAR
jgi:hypothetical protein